MRDMVPCIYRILDLKMSETDQVKKQFKLPNEGSYWKVLKVPIKTYLDDMLNVRLGDNNRRHTLELYFSLFACLFISSYRIFTNRMC
jgi:hypothetical protein